MELKCSYTLHRLCNLGNSFSQTRWSSATEVVTFRQHDLSINVWVPRHTFLDHVYMYDPKSTEILTISQVHVISVPSKDVSWMIFKIQNIRFHTWCQWLVTNLHRPHVYFRSYVTLSRLFLNFINVDTEDKEKNHSVVAAHNFIWLLS